jgi:hypothetical protein
MGTKFVVTALTFDTATGKLTRRDIKGFASIGAATHFAMTKNHAKGGSVVGDAKVEVVITSYKVEERAVF